MEEESLSHVDKQSPEHTADTNHIRTKVAQGKASCVMNLSSQAATNEIYELICRFLDRPELWRHSECEQAQSQDLVRVSLPLSGSGTNPVCWHNRTTEDNWSSSQWA